VGKGGETAGNISIAGENAALIALAEGSVLEIGGNFGSGRVWVGDGAFLSVGAPGDMIADVVNDDKADIKVFDGGALDIENSTVNGDVSVNDGTLQSGWEVNATATINGDLRIDGHGSTVEVDVTDNTSGGHDVYQVNGDVKISDGTVVFNFLTGSPYDPGLGDAFKFLTVDGDADIALANISAIAHGVDQDFRFKLTADGSSLGFEATNGSGLGESTVFAGGNLGDNFTGDATNDAIYGGGGDDVLSGGGAKADGIDIINGGAGADTLNGTDGSADFFEVSAQSDNYHAVENGLPPTTAEIDQINNFEVGKDTITFDPAYFSKFIPEFEEGVNFSHISGVYDGSKGYDFDGANSAFDAKEDALIMDADGNLIHDNNGSDPGYTIVAHINTTGGTVGAGDIHVNNPTA
jgi:Ca2+-binding RTX toxin-like protein